MRVLQIDDSEAFSHLYKSLFMVKGCHFESTTDGKDGLELVRKNDYDAILLDILMPKYGGIQFLEDLKNTRPSELKKITIISMMDFRDDELKNLKELGIRSIQKKSISLIKNLVDSLCNGEHSDQKMKQIPKQ
jgi:CheY-like chemotaxis protein